METIDHHSTTTIWHLLMVDDEPLASLRLKQLLEQTPWTFHITSLQHLDEAKTWLVHHVCHILLLDIQMPSFGASTTAGLDWALELQTLYPRPPTVIFVTAHSDYALQAFDVQAMDYLTKPVRLPRLITALDRALRTWGMTSILAPAPTPPHPPPPSSNANEDAVWVIRHRSGLIRLGIQDVLYCRAEHKYLTIRTHKAHYLIEDSLHHVLETYPNVFVRVHRNAVVHQQHLYALRKAPLDPLKQEGSMWDGWVILFEHIPDRVAVSRRLVSSIKRFLLENGKN